MKIDVITKPAFAVLGIEGNGPADKGPEWIKPLWDSTTRRLDPMEGPKNHLCSDTPCTTGTYGDAWQSIKT